MFQGLNDVRWSSLDHAYGPATTVPTMLALLRCRDPELRQRGFSDLWSKVHHQGSVYASTVAAIPFLVAIAAHPMTPDRVQTVRLVASIGVSAAERCGDSGVDEVADKAVATLRDHIEPVRGFAADADPAVREAAVPALAIVINDPGEAAAALRDRFSVEMDRWVQVALVAAMAALAVRAPTIADTTTRWLETVADDATAAPVVRLAAVAHRAHSFPETVDDDTVPAAITLLDRLAFAPPTPESTAAAAPPTSSAAVPPQVTAAFADMDRAGAETTPVSDLLGVLHTALGNRVADRAALVGAQLGHADARLQLDGIHDARTLMTGWRGDHTVTITALAGLLPQEGPVAAAAAAALQACHVLAEPAREALAAVVAVHEPATWQSKDRATRTLYQEAVRALARLGDVRAVPALAAVFDTGVEVWRAVPVTGCLPDAAAVLAPRMVAYTAGLDVAAGRDSMSVNAAMTALANLGDPVAIPVIVNALAAAPRGNDAGPSVIPGMLNALGSFGLAANDAAGAIQAFTASNDPHVQTAAIKAWWQITGDRSSTYTMALTLLDAPAWFALSDGADLLAQLGPEAVPAVPRLRTLLGHRYEWVRVAAATALWDITGADEAPQVLDVLMAAWERNSATARVTAPCLARMGTAARPALALVEAELARPRRDSYGSIAKDDAVVAACRAVRDQFTEP
ncbi:hypothetical protein LO763_21915 [Glycomyces sp. A-F 0318]|uniref:HEAT repeat domain-containing protein n=1 Tax=Glycomyces amatae TaxID=2881355 RepID=UPI001E49B95D|nr:hypothetical protein [Glycomyces amatae]MCD0446273.1 hypothetical protein [Glycomyces amatae]